MTMIVKSIHVKNLGHYESIYLTQREQKSTENPLIIFVSRRTVKR